MAFLQEDATNLIVSCGNEKHWCIKDLCLNVAQAKQTVKCASTLLANKVYKTILKIVIVFKVVKGALSYQNEAMQSLKVVELLIDWLTFVEKDIASAAYAYTCLILMTDFPILNT